MKVPIRLDYTLPTGALAPYFEALGAGHALASKCHDCGTVAFPPRALCKACRGRGFAWEMLSGQAEALHRTGRFALVQFAGADTRSTVALHNPESGAFAGRLIAPQENAPGLWLALDDEAGEGSDVR